MPCEGTQQEGRDAVLQQNNITDTVAVGGIRANSIAVVAICCVP